MMHKNIGNWFITVTLNNHEKHLIPLEGDKNEIRKRFEDFVDPPEGAKASDFLKITDANDDYHCIAADAVSSFRIAPHRRP